MALKHLAASPRQEARAWNLQLGVPGFKYSDLNRVRRIEALDRAFLKTLREAEPGLADDIERHRSSGGEGWTRLAEAELLTRVGPHVGVFIARLFRIEKDYGDLCDRIRADQRLFDWKRNFVERRVLKQAPSPEAVAEMDPVEIESAYRAAVDSVLPDETLSADPERELAEVTTALLVSWL